MLVEIDATRVVLLALAYVLSSLMVIATYAILIIFYN